MVTEVDKAVEVLVNKALSEKYPHFKFIGEESYVAGETKITDDPTFIVDPIEGTRLFFKWRAASSTSFGRLDTSKCLGCYRVGFGQKR